MQGMKRFSLRYVLCEVALIAFALALLCMADINDPFRKPWLWLLCCTAVGAAVGGLVGRIRLGALVGALAIPALIFLWVAFTYLMHVVAGTASF